MCTLSMAVPLFTDAAMLGRKGAVKQSSSTLTFSRKASHDG